MRELVCIAFLATAASAAEQQFYVCGPAWSRDRDCFRQQTIYFSADSAGLRDETKQAITEVAKFLKAHPSLVVQIEGHSDDRGSEEHNRWLGDRRAHAVAEELVRVGIAEDRIDTMSYGTNHPAIPAHDAGARKRNRRAEFVLLTPPPKS